MQLLFLFYFGIATENHSGYTLLISHHELLLKQNKGAELRSSVLTNGAELISGPEKKKCKQKPEMKKLVRGLFLKYRIS